MSFGVTELVIILVIVLLLFGTTKLKSIGSDLGGAIKGFRSAVKDEGEAEEDDDAIQAKEALAEEETAKSEKAKA